MPIKNLKVPAQSPPLPCSQATAANNRSPGAETSPYLQAQLNCTMNTPAHIPSTFNGPVARHADSLADKYPPWLPWFNACRTPEERELKKILAQGKVLYQRGEMIRTQVYQQSRPHSPPSAITAKAGLFMGVVGLLAGTGAGRYAKGFFQPQQSESASQPAAVHYAGSFNRQTARGAEAFSSSYAHHYPCDIKHHRHAKRHSDFLQPALTRDSLMAGADRQTRKAASELPGQGQTDYRAEGLSGAVDKKQPLAEQRPASASRLYSYTDRQPAECKTKRFKQRCQTAHHDLRTKQRRRAKQLVLKIGNTSCLCPPPAGARITIVPPGYLHQPRHNKTVTAIPPIIAQPITNPTMAAAMTSPIVPVTALLTASQTAQEGRQLTKRLNLAPRTDEVSAGAADGKEDPDSADQVKIEKLFDFSCIDERKKLSPADIIRQVGRTLSNPLKQVGIESQIIHHHKTLEKGCPIGPESQNLAEVLGKTDAILAQVMALLPHAQPLAVLQMIVGPALEIFSDGLDGKSANLQLMENIDQQILFMARQVIFTYTAEELSMLYNKNRPPSDNGSPAKEVFEKRKFIIKNKKLFVAVNDKEHQLHNDSYENPYIMNEGVARMIAYNNHQQEWELAGTDIVANRGKDEQITKEACGMPLSEFFGKSRYRVASDSVDQKLLFLENENGQSFHAVNMDGFIIPVHQFISGPFKNRRVILTYGDGVVGSKVILPTKSGWVFETKSSNFNTELEIFLRSSSEENSYPAEKIMSTIRNNGLCYDPAGKSYIKYNHRYYHVDWIANNMYVLDEADEVFVEKVEDVFTLRSASEVTFIPDAVDTAEKSLDGKSDIYLEREAYTLLQSEAQGIDTTSLSKLGSAVYIDNMHRKVFFVNGETFLASAYENDVVTLVADPIKGNQPEIKLYLNDNVYYKVRDNYHYDPDRYYRIGYCKVRRAADFADPGCLPIYMTKTLDDVLKKHIARHQVSKKNIFDKSIFSYDNDEFPQLYYSPETGNYYFLHDGNYIDAEWVSKGDKNNPLEKPVLRLFHKRFAFRLKQDIALVVCDKSESKFEIKTVNDHIAEKLQVKPHIAEKIGTMIKYRYIANFKDLSNAVNQVALSHNLFSKKLTLYFTPGVPDEWLRSIVLKYLYPDDIITNPSNTIKFHKLRLINDQHPLYLRKGSQHISACIRFIREVMLPEVISGLADYNADYENYLSLVLETNNIQFLSQFSVELSKRLDKISQNLNLEYIYITDLVKQPLEGYEAPEPKEVRYHQAVLTPEERSSGHVALALTDRSKRIYINLDKLYDVDPTHPDISMRQKPATDIITTLIHEASHIGTMTTDIVYFPRKEGEIIPVLSSIDDMIEKISHGQIVNKHDFTKLNEEYFGGIPIYRNYKIALSENNQYDYVASCDPGYLAHLLLNTADGLAVLARDLFYNKGVKDNPLAGTIDQAGAQVPVV
ncbi:hypothetical protein [Biostraticola tofi]|uniref:Uncharacterized protein n=1 Tax=Biostraticola tofi TaxID=466109 RepID=A0A4R3YS93_9GAMM|nr:hypothetical protein [Biostraticola tofi]TCV95246.1 hypothetical protein EDC52_106177 [Biostraticola tofi]